jgi:plastocyanin
MGTSAPSMRRARVVAETGTAARMMDLFLSRGGGPITATKSGTTATFTFPNAGTFGYTCTVHSSMTVVP